MCIIRYLSIMMLIGLARRWLPLPTYAYLGYLIESVEGDSKRLVDAHYD